MASYNYTRDLSEEDLAPRPAHVYTKKELWENWWDYNLKWVLAGLAGVALIGYFLVDAFILTPKVDYQIAIISPNTVFDSTLSDISSSLSPYVQDTTGDGVVTLSVYSYVVDLSTYSSATDPAALPTSTPVPAEGSADGSLSVSGDPSTYSYYTEIAGQVQMSADLESCESIIFILADPKSFQIASEMLSYPDGTLPQDPANTAWEELVYPIETCDVLSDEVKETLAGYYVARRGNDGTETVSSQFHYYQPLWDTLVQGATPAAQLAQ